MFRAFDFSTLAAFNSAASAEIIDIYKNAVKKDIISNATRPHSKTFSPSSLRCKRKQWFRLRGVTPELSGDVDIGLDYRACIGTHRHADIQYVLSRALGDDWINVDEYLRTHPIGYEYKTVVSGFETQITIADPPIRFACDGIARIRNEIYLSEIKTSDHSAFTNLSKPKDIHMDQVKCYCTLLKIPRALVIYEDRTNGEWKCFEVTFTQIDFDSILFTFEQVTDCVKKNIAPERLPVNDYMCSNCEYKSACKEW